MVSLVCCFVCIGAYDWAKTTLQIHAKDKRDYIYSRKQLEEAKTHDDLWNAAQVGEMFCICIVLYCLVLF